MIVPEYPVGSPYGQEEIDVVTRLMRQGGSMSFGPLRSQFEEAFARAHGAEFAVACNSGTVALWLAMLVAGIAPGDKVIASPQTYQTTIFPALNMGARVAFADIDPTTLNMDPGPLETLLDKKTKAVIVTYYGGAPAAMEIIASLCRQAGTILIADAAHAHGATLHGTPLGELADITCFSFQSLKNMTTLGEGGICLFRSREHRNMARELGNNGVHCSFAPRKLSRIGPYAIADPPLADHSLGSFDKDCASQPLLGLNFRMSELQAAVGLAQLEKLEEQNQQRRRVAALYDKHLACIPGIRLWEREKQGCSCHLYPAFLEGCDQKRHDMVINHLRDNGVEIVQRYFPLHLLHVMRWQGTGLGLCPTCERVWFQEQINLPIHPSISEDQAAYVADTLRKALAGTP